MCESNKFFFTFPYSNLTVPHLSILTPSLPESSLSSLVSVSVMCPHASKWHVKNRVKSAQYVSHNEMRKVVDKNVGQAVSIVYIKNCMNTVEHSLWAVLVNNLNQLTREDINHNVSFISWAFFTLFPSDWPFMNIYLMTL